MKKQIACLSLILSAITTVAQQLKSKDTLVNNDFTHRVIVQDLTYQNIIKTYRTIKQVKKPQANIYDPKWKDTVISVASGDDNFGFLKTKDKVLNISALVKSSTLTIDKDIAIGASAAIFKSKFQLKKIPNVLVVTDLEGSNIFTFTFNIQGRLAKMQYQVGYLE